MNKANHHTNTHEPDDVWVIEVGEILDFSQHFDCVAVLGVLYLDDFDGVNAFVELISRLDNGTEAARPKLIQHVKLGAVPLDVRPIGRQHF